MGSPTPSPVSGSHLAEPQLSLSTGEDGPPTCPRAQQAPESRPRLLREPRVQSVISLFMLPGRLGHCCLWEVFLGWCLPWGSAGPCPGCGVCSRHQRGHPRSQAAAIQRERWTVWMQLLGWETHEAGAGG